MSTRSSLTTTSYAILGLLAVQPWSTYELTQQMDRSLGRLWPRAQSKLYEEPKKLVDQGLAEARSEPVGQRPRTVYAITPEGRRALAAWLAEPGAGPVLEAEQLLKVFFAEHGTKADVLTTLAATQAWAQERNEGNLAAARAYLAGEGPFPQRAAQTQLIGRFLIDFTAMVAEWAEWATGVAETWPDAPANAQGDPEIAEDLVRRASW